METKNITFKPIPEYGDKMTLQEFKDCVDMGLFTNYDGTGYYASRTLMSNKTVDCSQIYKGKIDNTFTHVIWFNK